MGRTSGETGDWKNFRRSTIIFFHNNCWLITIIYCFVSTIKIIYCGATIILQYNITHPCCSMFVRIQVHLRQFCFLWVIELLSFSLFSYWTIVRKRLRDHVHLLVMYALCGKLRRWEELMDSLWKENSADYIELLVEDINVTQKRNRLQKRIQKLEETSRVLSSITATLNEYRGNNAATIES